MEKQIIEKHDELLITYKNTISKKRFPEYSIYENPEINYSEYIKTKIEEYKKEISEGLNEVIEIPIASNDRFESIVKRAFSKLPPFEGKDKKSDKGFKDALPVSYTHLDVYKRQIIEIAVVRSTHARQPIQMFTRIVLIMIVSIVCHLR